MSRLDEIRKQAAALMAEAERLSARPEEPVFEDDNAVIAFEKTFGGGPRTYAYTAIRITNLSGRGLWYISGSRAAIRPMPWEVLLDFIEQSETTMPQIWLASSWKELT